MRPYGDVTAQVHRLGEPLSRLRLEEEHTQAYARIAELEARLEAALDEHAEAKQVCSSAELKR
jgi:hypothetical protein